MRVNPPELNELSPEEAWFIKALPKTQLHVHLEGTMDAETLLTLAKKNEHPELMNKSPDEIMAMYNYAPGPDGFTQFLKLFEECSKVIQSPDDIVYVIERLGEDAARQNIRYAEVTFTPTTIANQTHGVPYHKQLLALERGIQSVRESTATSGRPVEIRFILDHSRGYTAEDCIATANMCMQGYEAGSVVGIGLAGGEDGDHPVSQWARLIRSVTRGQIPFVPHVAETFDAGPEAIINAYDSYPDGFPRLGHGIQAARDPKVLTSLADGPVLELCPTSNLATGAVLDLATMVEYVQVLQEAGVLYTINTDDPAQMPNILIPGQPNTLSKEFELMVRLGLETPKSLARMALLGISASLLPEEQKLALMEEVCDDLAQLGTVLRQNLMLP